MANNLFEQFREKLANDRANMAAAEDSLRWKLAPSDWFELVELLFNIVEAQQKEIEELKRKS